MTDDEYTARAMLLGMERVPGTTLAPHKAVIVYRKVVDGIVHHYDADTLREIDYWGRPKAR